MLGALLENFVVTMSLSRSEMKRKSCSRLKAAKKMNWQYQLAKLRAKRLRLVTEYKMVQIIRNPMCLDYLQKSRLKSRYGQMSIAMYG